MLMEMSIIHPFIHTYISIPYNRTMFMERESYNPSLYTYTHTCPVAGKGLSSTSVQSPIARIVPFVPWGIRLNYYIIS
jgi:hypothetical protein